MEDQMIQELVACWSARIPVIWTETYEEDRLELKLSQFINRVRTDENVRCISWKCTGGEDRTGGWSDLLVAEEGSEEARLSQMSFVTDDNPSQAILNLIDWANENDDTPCIAIMKDMHWYLTKNMFCRAVRDASALRATKTSLIFISPISNLPDDLRTDVTIVRPGLPERKSISSLVNEVEKTYPQACLEGVDKEALVEACRGLTLQQAEDVIARSLIHTGTSINVEYVRKAKAKVLSEVIGLTYEEFDKDFSDVGGLDGIKEWAQKRAGTFKQEARDFGIPPAKGIMIVGVPGTGKSLIGRAISNVYKHPLVSLDLGSLKGSLVGETEKNTRNALRQVDAIKPAILFIDEVEKGIPASSMAARDSGASAGMLGTILKWLQDREGGVFVVMTVNDLDGLPPELLRKGRLDEIFFVDLPDAKARGEIIKVHLKRIKRELPEKEIQILAENLGGKDWAYTGAEIEAAVNEGLMTAWNDNKRNLTINEIKVAASETVPLCTTMKERVESLRAWAKERARQATNSKRVKKDPRKRKIQTEKISLEE
jgi:ATP-dependent 26S proteasome regulatory subunit